MFAKACKGKQQQKTLSPNYFIRSQILTKMSFEHKSLHDDRNLMFSSCLCLTWQMSVEDKGVNVLTERCLSNREFKRSMCKLKLILHDSWTDARWLKATICDILWWLVNHTPSWQQPALSSLQRLLPLDAGNRDKSGMAKKGKHKSWEVFIGPLNYVIKWKFFFFVAHK